jgi:subtilisin family serine protease
MQPIVYETPEPAAAESPFVDGYHRNLLVVGARPEAARFAGTPAFHTLSAEETGAPGLGLLSILEQTGAVRQVYPLARSAAVHWVAPASLGAVGKVGAAAVEPERPDPLAGVSMVELRSESDVRAVLTALAEDPNVEFAARVPVRYLVEAGGETGATPAAPAPPPVGLMMWNLVKIGWQAARQEPGFVDAQDIAVAVLDTGIDPGHPDLQASVARYVHSYDHPLVPVHLSDRDVVGHGTHVAGTIAAGIDNGIGIHGICAARLHAYKIFDDREVFLGWQRGFGRVVNPLAYHLALRDCYDRRMAVVNLSIGGPMPPQPAEARLFRDLLDRGTAVVAAMGNGRSDGSPTSYPAAVDGVVAVGATRPDDRIAWFSNAGAHIALCAPGTAIWSTYPTYPGDRGHRAIPGQDGRPVSGAAIPRELDYGSSDGTSMAAPHVAAACALLLANRGSAPPSEIRRRLIETADRLSWMSGAGDLDYGGGRLSLHRALFI